MKVKNILEGKRRRGEILSVKTDDPVAEAVKTMVAHDTGSVAVYEGGSFIGMMTFREVLTVANDKGFGAVADTPCGELVEKGAHCVTPEDSVDQVRNLMTEHHIRYLPVVVEGRLTDVISFYDVARSVAKAVAFENRMLKEYIADWPADRQE